MADIKISDLDGKSVCEMVSEGKTWVEDYTSLSVNKDVMVLIDKIRHVFDSENNNR
jgi:hypothetical protein